MNIMEWVTTGTFAVVILSMAGMMIKMVRDNEEKHGRIYKRMDEVKESFERKHVSKDVFEIENTHIANDLREIKQDVKLLLRKNGFKDKF